MSQSEREKLADEMQRLRTAIEHESNKFRDTVYDIQELAYAAYCRKVSLDAQEHGVIPGAIMRLTRPMLWNGKMTPDLVVMVEAIEPSFRDDEKWTLYGKVRLKSGKWSERSTMIPSGWAELMEKPE